MITERELASICIPREHPCKHDWRVGRLTELLLMGHSWRQVQHFMAISKPEFDQLLDDAVATAKATQVQACTQFLERERSA